MLSRAADNLYWMARYMERAENMARILDVSYRMSLLPAGEAPERTQWEPALIIAGCDEPFAAKGSEINARNVIEFLALDPNNPSSIRAALSNARDNARAFRTQITAEMWEALNQTWIEMRTIDFGRMEEQGFRAFFDWVKDRSHLFRGVTYGTMQRSTPLSFVGLGTFIERADSTARLLDVKYHMLLPTPQDVGGAVDYYQWSALLRSVSAFQVYRRIYRDVITPARVAELLILRDDMPRSLLACFQEVTDILTQLREEFGRNYQSTRLAQEMLARLRYGTIEEVFEQGLHEFLTEFVDRIVWLGESITQDFLHPA
ncbi:MAG: alpha-E domain-containing protein [Proteobacteria bacterium]|nr:alpha-E domain-containing protein [Pseudomonadota bacterium]